MRGEHFTLLKTARGASGSSPRARGAHDPRRAQGRPRGIIPACAGSTSHSRHVRRIHRDHPRVRGEHPPEESKSRSSTGSSPRARGAHLAVVVDGNGAGIIPACAGSTVGCLSSTARKRDHPRVRGEHNATASRVLAGSGSSPRARGAHPGGHSGSDRAGIIPACAGSTAARCSGACARRDHPRVRGEHPDEIAAWGSRLGSSPRARGALAAGENRSGGPGIIPACAGSTPTSSATMTAPRDHPRVRGEHSIRAVP